MRFAPCAALLALIVASPAFAAWPHDPVTGNVPVCTATAAQNGQRVVSDGAGGAFVVWSDMRSSTMHAYVQHVGAAGVPLWTANGVLVNALATAQSYPSLCSDGAGGVVVAWADHRPGTSTDLYAQRFDATGVPQWTANGVAVCATTGDQTYPELVPDGAGGAVIAWQDSRGAGLDVYVQRIGSGGTPAWTVNGVPACAAANAQLIPKLATDGVGGAIVTWYDFRSGNPLIYAQRVNAAGSPVWTADGVAIAASTSGPKVYPDIVADGIGGAVIAWQDWRSGSTYDIYAQRVSAGGGTYWTLDGVALCTAADNQSGVSLASDGSGGAIVGWADVRAGIGDVYLQRVLGAGTVAWVANGVQACPVSAGRYTPQLVSDGAGGAIVTWYDYRNFAGDVYAQRLDASGVARWPSEGVALSVATGTQSNPAIASDGLGGAVVVWQDDRLGNPDLYAQRVERYGYLGPEPAIATVRDVRNDQGGQVKVSWNASWLDAYPGYVVSDYRLWRSVPAAALAARAVPSRAIVGDPDRAAAQGLLLASPYGVSDYAWELVGTQAADGLAAYSLVAATTSDSTATANPRTAFMIEARASASPLDPHWFSAADSGYSVDNLAPVAPAPFTGTYAAGTATLTWNRNAEPDLAAYRLYRGTSTAFVPGPGNLVAQQTESVYADAAGQPYVYKLTAVDVHGNESPAATVIPGGTAGVDEAGALTLAFAPPSPSPASRTTTMRFTLPVAGAARLAILDASGRNVRTLAAGEQAAGVHTLTWDLRDDAGQAVAAGMYFARFEAAGCSTVRRLVVTR